MDSASGKLALGLKPSYFTGEDEEMGAEDTVAANQSSDEDDGSRDLDVELAEEYDAAVAAGEVHSVHCSPCALVLVDAEDLLTLHKPWHCLRASLRAWCTLPQNG